MPDIFRPASHEEIQKRRLDRIEINVKEAIEMVYLLMVVPGKLPLEKAEEIKQALISVNDLIEDLKIKIR